MGLAAQMPFDAWPSNAIPGGSTRQQQPLLSVLLIL